MTKSLCLGLPPRGSVYLIAIIDTILGVISLLLCTVALGDLEKVFGPLEEEFDEDGITDRNRQIIQSGIDKFTHLHGQMVIGLMSSIVFLLLAIGLFWGVRREWPWPIKAWLISSFTLILLLIISVLVVTVVTNELWWLLLFLVVIVRIYQVWIVLDYMKHSRFSFVDSHSVSTTSSTERLHNV